MLLDRNMAGMPLEIQPIYLRNCFPKGGKTFQKNCEILSLLLTGYISF